MLRNIVTEDKIFKELKGLDYVIIKKYRLWDYDHILIEDYKDNKYHIGYRDDIIVITTNMSELIYRGNDYTVGLAILKKKME